MRRARVALMAIVAAVAAVAVACDGSAPRSSTASTTTSGAPRATTTTPPRCAPQETAGVHVLDGRSYSIALPHDDGRRHPAILLFHGFASSKEAIDADTGLDRSGAARGYVVVTPDGSSSPRTWNFLTGKSGSDTDDFAFVDDLVTHVERTSCVDATRVFAAGHSAGSAFVGFLVCRAPYRFAGAAMVSATIPSTCPPAVTPAILSIHGTADPVVLYDGGLGQGQTVPIPPVRDTVANHAKRSGCAPTPVRSTPAPGIERLTYVHCKPGAAVALVTVVGGGHPWPGGLQATHPVTVPGSRYSATGAILDFFDAVRGRGR